MIFCQHTKMQSSILIGKSKVKKKTLDVIKDDRQAFEILLGEVQTLCEANNSSISFARTIPNITSTMQGNFA